MSQLPLKNLPIDIQSFDKLIENGCIYVDKTQHMYQLLKRGSNYFLSRPRRFGKSLLISTFHELFAGRRDLFKGLWIDSSDYVWAKYPVVHLDFSMVPCTTLAQFNAGLLLALKRNAYANDISMSPMCKETSRLC